jgi:hypothetical protein
MNFNDNSNLEAKERNLLTLGPCRSWAIQLVAILVCLVPTSTAFGYSYYSDEWVDNSDPTNMRIVGSGVTYDPDNGYMGTPHGYQQIHSYWVKITLTSPSGRTVTLTSNQSYSYASREASLPLLVNGDYDLGNYSTETQHWMCCPYMQPNPWDGQRCYPNASSAVGIRVGASSITFQNSGIRDSQNRCIMNVIQPCNVICTGRGQTNEPECSPFSIWIEPWYRWGDGNYVCLGFFSSVLEKRISADNSQPCFES